MRRSSRPPAAVDVLVLGGGPGGSTAASLLARAGADVLVVERETFPRFHIGESLLPYNVPLLRRLGVWERLLAHGFQRKHGARFVFEPEQGEMRLDFARSLDRSVPMALQVRRAAFDALLLDAAREHGAQVLEGTAVESALVEGERAVGARLRVGSGSPGAVHDVRARLVIDATGRTALLGRQLGLVERDPALRQAALFTQVEGARMALGTNGGDILIVGGPYGWFWLIPLDARTTSVGVVFPAAVARRHDGARERLFEALVAESPEVSARLDGAQRLLPITATADFSYRCRRFAGAGWLLVGDAAGFLDPVFSSGVMLAMSSGESAARSAERALRRRTAPAARDLAGHDRFVRRGLDRFRRYILAFYDPACASIMATEPPSFLARAAVSAFAGKVYARDPRIWLFDRVFFTAAARLRRRAARGKLELPAAPASG
ncbi:MAG: NAD(P)/FAD-dependent oxidoreductase [Acidobacteriota bacterium]